MHATSCTLVSIQQEESEAAVHEEGTACVHSYLHGDLQQLQMMKKHHVHLRNHDTNLRVRLVHAEEKRILYDAKRDLQE